MHSMDSVFSLPEGTRANFLSSIMQSCGCAYICLWSYDSLISNRLLFLDGFYSVRNNQPSSSLGSVAQRLFNEYRGLAFDVSDDRLPGMAFKSHSPYLELQQPDLLRRAWTEIQRRFFQEARIKTAVFMGCNKGEFELGFSTVSQADVQTALRNWFPDDFSRQSQPIDQNPPSSSSSSLRSLSTGSPEYSSLLFSAIPGTSHFPAETTLGGVPTMQPVSTTACSPHPHHQAIQALAQVTQSPLFPTPESEHDAIMRAILHVLSSPSSSTSHHQAEQNLPYSSVVHPDASAFKRYRPDLGPNITSQMGSSNLRKPSLLKRSFAFFRSLNLMRMRERVQATRPSSTQLHHMISERRRREKLNENFRALRSLLPPGTKKDKASILTAAKETLRSLMAEIEKLSKRNKQLEASMPAKETSDEDAKIGLSNERLTVRVSNIPESSSSEGRIIDLQVTVRGQSTQVDILIRLLEFLKQDQNVSLISMGANTHIAEGTSFNQVTIRLRIEGSEWDESGFQEAVRRVVADLAQ